MRNQRGDTIIEVILAVAIFSLVAVGAMSLMNSGISMAQRSLEITQVRHQVDGQAELLRYVSSNGVPGGEGGSLWDEIKDRYVADEATSILNETSCPARDSQWFSLLANGTNIVASEGYLVAPATYARVNHLELGGVTAGSEGISIQLVEAQGGGAYDAHIQACWYTPGSPRPATIGTIVRLYDQNA